MAAIDHEIKISASCERVHQALTTPEGLRAWKTSDVHGSGAIGTEWKFGFPGQADFQWRIAVNDPDRVVWECTQGPGDAVGTSTVFTIQPVADGRTLLTCQHAGWPDAHRHFRKCNTTWGVLLHHLKTYVETGRSSPAFS